MYCAVGLLIASDNPDLLKQRDTQRRIVQTSDFSDEISFHTRMDHIWATLSKNCYSFDWPFLYVFSQLFRIHLLHNHIHARN